MKHSKKWPSFAAYRMLHLSRINLENFAAQCGRKSVRILTVSRKVPATSILLVFNAKEMVESLVVCILCRHCQCVNLFCSLAVLDPRVGHTMDVLSPFIPVLCHSDWLFHGESCPRLDVVHPGHAWTSSPACTWHCSLHYLFLQAFLPCFLVVWP